MYIRSFSKMMDEAVDIVKRHLGEVALTQFLSLLLIAGGGFIAMIMIVVVSLIGAAAKLSSASPNAAIFIPITIGIVISVILILALEEVQVGSIMALTNSVFKGKPIKVTKAISVGIKNIIKIIGVMSLKLVGLIPVGLIGLLQLFIIGAIVTNGDDWLSSPSSLFRLADSIYTMIFFGIIILLNIVIFIAVLAIYSTFYLTMMPAIIVDSLGPIKAFKQNWQLVKKDFFGVAKKIFVYKLSISGINLCLSMLVGVMIGMIALLLEFIAGEVDYIFISNALSIIQWPVQLIYGLIIGAFEPAIIVIFYHSQKCKVQGSDLQEQLNQMKYKAAKEYEDADGDANSI